jgi:hypothetical protein
MPDLDKVKSLPFGFYWVYHRKLEWWDIASYQDDGFWVFFEDKESYTTEEVMTEYVIGHEITKPPSLY